MSDVTRAEVCAVAVADALRGDGEILVSCFGTVPSVGARLARRQRGIRHGITRCFDRCPSRRMLHKRNVEFVRLCRRFEYTHPFAAHLWTDAVAR